LYEDDESTIVPRKRARKPSTRTLDRFAKATRYQLRISFGPARRVRQRAWDELREQNLPYAVEPKR
jgi:hypothetical protein